MTETTWQALHAQLLAWLRRRVAPEVAEDLAQEALARVVERLPTLRDPSAVGPWAQRIARSVLIDHLRRDRPTAELPELADDTPDDLPDVRPLVAFVASVIDRLPETQAEAVRLVDLEGLSRREAADRLGLSVKGLNSRVQRGRAALRAELEACCAVDLGPRGDVVAWAARSGCCAG